MHLVKLCPGGGNTLALAAFLSDIPTTSVWLSLTMLEKYREHCYNLGWECSIKEVHKILNIFAEEGIIWVDADHLGRVRQIKRIINL